MTRLIQLKNGDWIDPATVKSITALDEMDSGAGFQGHSPRVVVWYGRFGHAAIDYPDLEAACRARDALAAIVNETEASES